MDEDGLSWKDAGTARSEDGQLSFKVGNAGAHLHWRLLIAGAGGEAGVAIGNLRQHRQHRLRPLLGTCRGGREPARQLSSQPGYAGPQGCCSNSAPDPRSLTLLTVLTVFSGNERIRITLLPGSAFTTERNLDTEHPKKRLCATQVAGEGAGIFRPTGAVARDTITAAFNADPAEDRRHYPSRRDARS